MLGWWSGLTTRLIWWLLKTCVFLLLLNSIAFTITITFTIFKYRRLIEDAAKNNWICVVWVSTNSITYPFGFKLINYQIKRKNKKFNVKKKKAWFSIFSNILMQILKWRGQINNWWFLGPRPSYINCQNDLMSVWSWCLNDRLDLRNHTRRSDFG